MKRLIELGFLACVAASAAAHPAKTELSVVERAARLGPGQFVWDAKAGSTGPLFLVIDLTRQRALLYRDGVPIAASTISTGSKGRETPTGVFTILQKEVMHRSGTYDDAPMPYMQRLTSKGVAMHAGNLPGYAASHGCIRLPRDFAKLLYGVTEIGTPVMITDDANWPSRREGLPSTSSPQKNSTRRGLNYRRKPIVYWPNLTGQRPRTSRPCGNTTPRWRSSSRKSHRNKFGAFAKADIRSLGSAF